MNRPAFTILAAVAIHLVFNRTEPRQAPSILALLFVPPTLITLLNLTASQPTSVIISIIRAFLTQSLFLLALVSSVVIYRVSPFHPLARYPGPLSAKVSRLTAFWIAKGGKQHLWYDELHRQYGEYVRIGPNHLHISDARAIPAILNSKDFVKGGRYTWLIKKSHDDPTPANLLNISSPTEHALRRKPWDKALNGPAIKGYQVSIDNRVTQLVDQLKARVYLGAREDKDGDKVGHLSGEAIVDMAKWIGFFSFDFMGDLAYGGVFNILQQGKDIHDLMEAAAQGARSSEVFGTIPWIGAFFQYLPPPPPITRIKDIAVEVVNKRKEKGLTSRDLFSYLLDEDGDGSKALPMPLLVVEAILAIIAGSDTTATSLNNFFYYTLSKPAVYEKLKEEVDKHVAGAEGYEDPTGLEYMNAIINETLRLQPVVPNGVQRVLVPECKQGKLLPGEHWIPPGTTVQVGTYTVHRLESNFSPSPNAFIPERWLSSNSPLASNTKIEWQMNKDAFTPFSFGPTNCPGKLLALTEMRSVIVTLLSTFDFELVSADQLGADASELTESKKGTANVKQDWEGSLKDGYVLMTGNLWVKVRARKDAPPTLVA